MQVNAQIPVVNAQMLIQKIQSLPPERMLEVDDFVDFLRVKIEQSQAHAQDRALTRMASEASEPSFANAWDNAEDEAYDAI